MYECDEVEATVKIIEVSERKMRLSLEFICVTSDGREVLSGDSWVKML